MSNGVTNPILFEIPESFETNRLLIRAPLWGDDTETNARKARLHFLERSDLRLNLFLKKTGEFIGRSGLHRIEIRCDSRNIRSARVAERLICNKQIPSAT
jgi:hypothetical protein